MNEMVDWEDALIFSGKMTSQILGALREHNWSETYFNDECGLNYKKVFLNFLITPDQNQSSLALKKGALDEALTEVASCLTLHRKFLHHQAHSVGSQMSTVNEFAKKTRPESIVARAAFHLEATNALSHRLLNETPKDDFSEDNKPSKKHISMSVKLPKR